MERAEKALKEGLKKLAAAKKRNIAFERSNVAAERSKVITEKGKVAAEKETAKVKNQHIAYLLNSKNWVSNQTFKGTMHKTNYALSFCQGTQTFT